MIVVNARFLTQKLTGVQRFAYELSSRLKDKLGDEVVFVAPQDVIQHDMAERLGAKCVGKHSGYYWEQVELPLYLWRCGSPKLVNFCSVAPLLYGNNYVAVHDITWVRYPETFSKAFCIVYNFLIPRLCKRAKKLITVSEFSKREISSCYNIPKEKFTVIYNAVGEMFHPIEDKILRNENYFLVVSSVKVNKNFLSVLKAFEIVLRTNPNIRLYIVGDCNDKNFQTINIDRYKNNPSIKFLGRVSDHELVKYYSNAQGFVFPSLYEGFGIPVLEAQACGCPVLASDIPSLREVLNDSALFCNPLEIDDIAFKMKQLLPEQNMLVQNGYRNVKRFSWDKSADQCLKMLCFKNIRQ